MEWRGRLQDNLTQTPGSPTVWFASQRCPERQDLSVLLHSGSYTFIQNTMQRIVPTLGVTTIFLSIAMQNTSCSLNAVLLHLAERSVLLLIQHLQPDMCIAL